MKQKILRGALCTGAAVALLGGAQVGWGYKIVFPYDIHESITRAAATCLGPDKAKEPGYCGTYHDAMRKDSFPQTGERYSPLERSTRWADDPTRSIESAGLPKYLLMLTQICGQITGPTSRLDEVGLTCSSHFGRLQFMHAQASRLPDGKAEPDSLTRQKMLSWARFAFRVATAQDDTLLNSDYCAVAGQLENIGQDLAPSGFLQCRPGKKKTWVVASLFNIKCGNPVTWEVCGHQWGPKPNRRARRFAAGAILHMIQDSYSQSHVYRGSGPHPDPRHKFKPLIVCRPAKHFYEYNEQAGGHHSDADAPPALDKESCRPGAQIDDVITASAKVIWHIDHGKDEAAFVKYLEDHVLG